MSRISRRTFLYFSAVAAGTWSLSACTAGDDSDGNTNGGGVKSGSSGSAAEPLPKPATFQQAPSLDGQDLPPVEERLPDNPYVIPHSWVQPGKYGGTINMNVFSSTGAATADSDREFFYGHSPLRFLNDGKDVVPGLVESWETNDDASEWTFRFRKGLKWSDGEAWTTENILSQPGIGVDVSRSLTDQVETPRTPHLYGSLIAGPSAAGVADRRPVRSQHLDRVGALPRTAAEPRNLEEVVLPGSPCWQGVDTHRHFIVPEGAEAWFDIAYDGIDQLAQSTGSRWTITHAHGNADGIGLYVAERETETLFHAQASGTFTAAKIDEAAVSSMTMSLRDSTNRDLTARDLAANLRTVAASHRAMRALGNVLGALRLPAGVTRDLDGDTLTFRRGNCDVLQLDVDDTGLYVTTATTHPVTGRPLSDRFEITMSSGGSMQIQREWGGPAGREEPATAPGLAAWVDRMTGDEGLLWRACHSTHAAATRYAPVW